MTRSASGASAPVPRALALLALALLTLVLLGAGFPAAAASDGPVRHRTLFAMTDPEIVEASGLVDRGRTVLTINDSGAGPVVYGVSDRTGRTVSRTTYSTGTVTDVEALAPGPAGTVWVGDIGDNRAGRDDVTLYRVRTPAGRTRTVAPRYRLVYPDGPHDAETLLADPRSGRLFVVSKTPFGGTVYAAPRRLRAGSGNRLRPFAQVDGLVTDGAFFPDGRHVVIRTYGTASVYTFPGFRRTGTVVLPPQRQGEGISVGRSGRVLIGSEGQDSPVLQVFLPAGLTAGRGGAATSPTGPDPAAARPASPTPQRPAPRDSRDWVTIGLVGAGVLGLVWLSLRASRVRQPRR